MVNVLELIQNFLEKPEITLDTVLDDINIDSLDRLELAMYLEDHIQDLSLDDDSMASCNTIQDIVNLCS